MAFAVHNLSVLAYADGFTLWHYRTESDGLAAATLREFFHEASDMLTGGDMVMVSSPDGGRILCVAASDAGMVTAPMC